MLGETCGEHTPDGRRRECFALTRAERPGYRPENRRPENPGADPKLASKTSFPTRRLGTTVGSSDAEIVG